MISFRPETANISTQPQPRPFTKEDAFKRLAIPYKSVTSQIKEEEQISFELNLEKENKANINERRKILREALHFYTNGNFDQAIFAAKRLYQLSKTMAEESSSFDIKLVIADGLFLVKCLLNEDRIKSAREILLEVWEITQEEIQETRIPIILDERGFPSKAAQLRENFVPFTKLNMLSYERKARINE